MWKQQVLLLGEVVERLPDTIKQKESRASHHFFPLKVAGLKSSHEREASFDQNGCRQVSTVNTDTTDLGAWRTCTICFIL